MYRIAIVSAKPASLSVLAQALQADGRIAVEWASSGGEALKLIAGAAPDLMILDEKEGEPPDFSLVREIMRQNALINIAMIGGLPEKEFHEAAEGLGVLMQLPPKPGRPEAEALLARLSALTSANVKGHWA
jgi:chemotaxis response regulator CheB